MTDWNERSAVEIADAIAAGTTTCEAVAGACLERISERDGTVRAWVHVDPGAVLEAARELDRGPSRGPLHGVPIGVKDIIDTADMPTQMGSPIYEGHRPLSDASCVGMARAAGALVLGKTVTCEFAGSTAGATTNPHNAGHTPGGSSSGSAAAVADNMVPLAFGTQTGGSVLRPSSFCGIFGYKPSFGTFNLGGVMHAAESLDTLGIHARELDDVALMTSVLTGRPAEPVDPVVRGPRVGICRTPLWDEASPESRDAVTDAAARMEKAGAKIQDVVLPDEFAGLTDARDVFNNVERARLMAWEWAERRDLISPRLRSQIEKGLETPHEEYVAAHRLAESCRSGLSGVFYGVDVLLTPVVAGIAPEGLDSTGDPRFQGLWTILHLPTMTLPTYRGPKDLPVGIQLVAPWREDDRLFAVAGWVWDCLAP